MTEGRFTKLRLFVPDPYDLILSKLQRGSQKGVDDANYLFKIQKLDNKKLRERYVQELRMYLIGPPERHDGTLDRWIGIFESSA